MATRRLLMFLVIVGASIQLACVAPSLWKDIPVLFLGTPTALAATRTPTRIVPSPTPLPPTPTRTPVVPTEIPPTATSVERDSVYIVQPGDTLAAIADVHDISLEKLAYLNKISDWNVIFPGQELILEGEMPEPPAEDDCDQGKNIVVILESQMLYARDGCDIVREFIVSTGVAERPTVMGDYSIYLKLEKTDMVWPGLYDLSDVPWTMYFHKGFGIHGKYWNTIYGTPSSSGCINMTIVDAKWLYDWAEVGTPVHVRKR